MSQKDVVFLCAYYQSHYITMIVMVCVGQHGEDDQWDVHGGDRETGAGATHHGRTAVPLCRHRV